MDNIYFAKVKEKAKIPSKREEDGCYDIYACFDEDYIEIPPHEVKLIPTGIASAFSSDYVMVLKERGSTGSKNMTTHCGVIDSGFRNEWFVAIANDTNNFMFITKLTKEELINKRFKPQNFAKEVNNILFKTESILDLKLDCSVFYPYEKAICQALLLPVPKVKVNELSYEDLKNIKSERGLGMLGSSNK